MRVQLTPTPPDVRALQTDRKRRYSYRDHTIHLRPEHGTWRAAIYLPSGKYLTTVHVAPGWLGRADVLFHARHLIDRHVRLQEIARKQRWN